MLLAQLVNLIAFIMATTLCIENIWNTMQMFMKLFLALCFTILRRYLAYVCGFFFCFSLIDLVFY